MGQVGIVGRLETDCCTVWLFLNLAYQEAVLTLSYTKCLSQVCSRNSSVVHGEYIKKYVLNEHKSDNIPRKLEATEQNLYLVCHYKFDKDMSGNADLKQFLIIEMYILALDTMMLQQPE